MERNHAIARVLIQGEQNDVTYNISGILSDRNIRRNGNEDSGLQCSIESVSIPIFSNLPDTTILFIDSLGVSHNLAIIGGLQAGSVFASMITALLTTNDTGGAVYSFTLNLDSTIIFTSTAANWSINMNDPYWQQRSGLFGLQATTTNSITTDLASFISQLIIIETNLCQGVVLNNLTPPAISSRQVLNGTNIMTLVLPTSNAIQELSSIVLAQNLTYFAVQQYFGEYGTKFKIQTDVSAINIRITDELGFPIITSPQRWYITLTFS